MHACKALLSRIYLYRGKCREGVSNDKQPVEEKWKEMECTVFIHVMNIFPARSEKYVWYGIII